MKFSGRFSVKFYFDIGFYQFVKAVGVAKFKNKLDLVNILMKKLYTI